MQTITVSRHWHKAIEQAPPEFKAIAFTVQGYPMPIAGYFENNAFYQVCWCNKTQQVASSRIESEVEMWRSLEIGTKAEAESSFSVLEGDR
jgi:hypothetical protein